MGGPALKDIAHLTGGFNPTGTITFTLYFDGNSFPQDTETVSVSGNGDYTTPVGYVPIAAGSYQWDASYSGDSNNVASSDVNASDEQVTVSSTSLALTTALSFTTITAGGSDTDTAHLTGGVNPTGTITFFFSITDRCPIDGATQVGSPISVSGDGDYPSSSGSFGAAGTYYWYATYSGDSNNNGATSACEPLVVNPASTGVPQFPTPMLLTTAIAFLALSFLLKTKRSKTQKNGRTWSSCLQRIRKLVRLEDPPRDSWELLLVPRGS